MQSEWSLRCTTPECDSIPFRIKPRLALAVIEHSLDSDPDARFRLPCETCGQTTSYSRDAILRMIPPSELPRLLPSGQAWAFLLIKMETTFDQNAFMGERLLVDVANTTLSGEWRGRLVIASEVAPGLRGGVHVAGEIAGGFRVIESIVAGGRELPIEMPDLHSQFTFALFLSPKSGDPLNLQCANLFCANPSCPTVFSLTSREYEARRGRPTESSTGVVSAPQIYLECMRCGTFRIVDDQSFAGLAQV